MHGGANQTLFHLEGTAQYNMIGNVRINKVPTIVITEGNPRSLVANLSIQSHNFTTSSPFNLKTIGTEPTIPLGRGMTGNFCEIVVFSPPITDSQLINVETYLMNKWGIV